MNADALLERLQAMANPRDAANAQRFFKTGPGEYGEGDVFLGIRVPPLRQLSREVRREVPLEETIALLSSDFHEARALALMLLVSQFERGDEATQRAVYRAYLDNTAFINNWDLVDLSAPQIVGGWLLKRDRAPLRRLAGSTSLWERRIAVLATFAFIRAGDFKDTLMLAERFLRDEHDLMQKAVGWMLREVGKRDVRVLEGFLARHNAAMPRTMLRYAIEKFPAERRRQFLARKRTVW